MAPNSLSYWPSSHYNQLLKPCPSGGEIQKSYIYVLEVPVKTECPHFVYILRVRKIYLTIIRRGLVGVQWTTTTDSAIEKHRGISGTFSIGSLPEQSIYPSTSRTVRNPVVYTIAADVTSVCPCSELPAPATSLHRFRSTWAEEHFVILKVWLQRFYPPQWLIAEPKTVLVVARIHTPHNTPFVHIRQAYSCSRLLLCLA